MSDPPARVLVFGAHPDDAEVYAAGLLVRHRNLGNTVKIISVTDGRSGHYARKPEELVTVRRDEAARAGQLIGAEYITWDFPDGALLPTLDVRHAIIREIRRFRPDLVLTHRPYDYHPDHRAVGAAVQDACYMLTVPHVCPDVPALERDPVVASMCDLFTRPVRMRADVVLDIGAEFHRVVEMAACHESQFFEWLPYHDGILHEVPADPADRLRWLAGRLEQLHLSRLQFFAPELRQLREADEDSLECIEVYEISEYAADVDDETLDRLFPGRLTPAVRTADAGEPQ